MISYTDNIIFATNNDKFIVVRGKKKPNDNRENPFIPIKIKKNILLVNLDRSCIKIYIVWNWFVVHHKLKKNTNLILSLFDQRDNDHVILKLNHIWCTFMILLFISTNFKTNVKLSIFYSKIRMFNWIIWSIFLVFSEGLTQLTNFFFQFIIMYKPLNNRLNEIFNLVLMQIWS